MLFQRKLPMMRTIRAAIQAMAHCQTTRETAHFMPSSRRTAATAATQGVYSREKTRSPAAMRGVITEVTPPSYRISSVETTLRCYLYADPRKMKTAIDSVNGAFSAISC